MSFTRTTVTSRPMLYVASRCSMNPDDIAAVMDKSFKTLGVFLGQNHVAPVGPPFSIYSGWDGEAMAVEVGFPVDPSDVEKAGGEVLAGKTPEGPALKTLHKGAYSGLSAAYRRLEDAMKEAGLKGTGLSWEVYLMGPGMAEESAFETEIYMSAA